MKFYDFTRFENVKRIVFVIEPANYIFSLQEIHLCTASISFLAFSCVAFGKSSIVEKDWECSEGS